MLSTSSKNCPLFESQMKYEMENIINNLEMTIQFAFNEIWGQMTEM